MIKKIDNICIMRVVLFTVPKTSHNSIIVQEGNDSWEFIRLQFETRNSTRVCINYGSKVLIATAFYENGCIYLRKLCTTQ